MILIRGGQPAARGPHAAQKRISAAQTWIETRRFFDILGVFHSFYQNLAQKINIFGNFPKCGPKTDLGWPPLILIIHPPGRDGVEEDQVIPLELR